MDERNFLKSLKILLNVTGLGKHLTFKFVTIEPSMKTFFNWISKNLQKASNQGHSNFSNAFSFLRKTFQCRKLLSLEWKTFIRYLSQSNNSDYLNSPVFIHTHSRPFSVFSYFCNTTGATAVLLSLIMFIVFHFTGDMKLV